jgi:hypothetical protein
VTITLHRAAAAALAVLAALTAAGCASSHGSVATVGATSARPAAGSTGFPTSQPLPSGTAGSLPVELPQPSSIDDQDPSAVSKSVVLIQWTMDTTIDTSQYQAELRSAPFLTAGYLASLKANPPVAAPGAQWNDWTSHHATTAVATLAEHDDQPIDSPTQARRQWGITVTPHGRDGWTGTPVTATVFVTMSRAGTESPWLVSAITVSS